MKKYSIVILLLLFTHSIHSMNQKNTIKPTNVKDQEKIKTIKTHSNDDQGCFFCCSTTNCLKKLKPQQQ